MRNRLSSIAFIFILLFSPAVGSSRARGEDWPTYMHDSGRTGVTADRVALPLVKLWTFRSLHPPQPAWPISEWNEAKTSFDRVFHPVVAGGRLYFASSADGKVYCLNAVTGRELWSFFTGGPVRVAPTVWNRRVYVGSDDGWAYCLRAADGKVVWKFKGAPGTQRVLGNGRMISMWPVRTGVLVDGGVAYFAAGLFPSEGVYIHALDAKTGARVWTNDSAYAMYITHAHAAYNAFVGISPQGALVVDSQRLFIPMGRNVPAALDRENGRFLYLRYVESHRIISRDGGASLSLAEGGLFTSPGNTASRGRAACFDPASGVKLFGTPAKQLIVAPDGLLLLERNGIRCVDKNYFDEAKAIHKKLEPDLSAFLRGFPKPPAAQLRPKVRQVRLQLQELERKKRRTASCKWRVSGSELEVMMLAGDVLFAGGRDEVRAFDAASGKELWKGSVKGAACALAAAGGRLYVSTDVGAVYCFGKTSRTKSKTIVQRAAAEPYPKDALTEVYAAAADAIAAHSGLTRGYCLVLDGGTGRLAYELARRTRLQIYCLSPDERAAAVARKRLDSAGLYGVRVTVDAGTTERLPYSNYFANLVVSDRCVATGEIPAPSDEILRVLKPCGGTVLLGRPAEAGEKVPGERMRNWLKLPREVGAEIIEEKGRWLKLTRGPLPGAADWTHQWAGAAATGCSEDKRVKAPFRVLWFGKPGPLKSNKWQTPCALSTGGRIFIARSPVQAYDAYNGLKLWETPITNAQFSAATLDSLYVSLRKTNECLRLDAASGKLLRKIVLPARNGTNHVWAYLAVAGEFVLGTGLSGVELDAADKAREAELKKVRVVESLLRAGTVRILLQCNNLWGFMAKDYKELMAQVDKVFAGLPAERIAKYKNRLHRLIAGTSSRYLCAMNRVTGKPVWTYDPGDAAYICHSSIAVGAGRVFLVEGRETQGARTTKHLVTLDLKTGRKLRETGDLTKYCRPRDYPKYSTVNSTELLSVAYKDGILVFGEVWGGRNLFALSAADGKLLWSQPVGYNTSYMLRPLIIGDAVHTRGHAYQLTTGEMINRKSPITGKDEPWQFIREGGCGGTTASAACIFFRSADISYIDLEDDQGITNLSGVRPSCWVSIVPAAGLVLAPDQSRGCICSFPLKTSVVLYPTEEHRAWSMINLTPDQLPVKHLALNLGAPGDRRDKSGVLWLGYPRPKVGHGYKFELDAEIAPGLGFFGGPPDGAGLEGSAEPWIFASGVRGLKKITIPVDKGAKSPADFSVELFFAEPSARKPGERVFDVKLQGKVVERGFDIARIAGGPKKALTRTYKLKLTNSLTIELAPKAAKLTASNAPILNGIKIIRQ